MTRKVILPLVIILFMALALAQGIASQTERPSTPKILAPGMVNTVLGPVKAENLGVTLMHEHFAFAYPGWFSDATLYPEDWQKALKVNLGVVKLAKAVGIKTIVDATPNDVGGRNPTLYKTLAKRTGVNIICSTGLYTEHEGSPAYWRTRVPWGADISEIISEVFIREITQGIGKTGIEAGVIKVGTGPEISPYEAAVLKAAAKA